MGSDGCGRVRSVLETCTRTSPDDDERPRGGSRHDRSPSNCGDRDDMELGEGFTAQQVRRRRACRWPRPFNLVAQMQRTGGTLPCGVCCWSRMSSGRRVREIRWTGGAFVVCVCASSRTVVSRRLKLARVLRADELDEEVDARLRDEASPLARGSVGFGGWLRERFVASAHGDNDGPDDEEEELRYWEASDMYCFYMPVQWSASRLQRAAGKQMCHLLAARPV